MASVDAIQINHRLDLDNDLEMSGQVVWTGKSSMDIRMEITQVAATTTATPLRHHGHVSAASMLLAGLARCN